MLLPVHSRKVKCAPRTSSRLTPCSRSMRRRRRWRRAVGAPAQWRGSSTIWRVAGSSWSAAASTPWSRPGRRQGAFTPDPMLVALAVRQDAVFAYHAALELLGVGHSAWNRSAVFTARRRASLSVGPSEIGFCEDPLPLRAAELRHLGTRKVERRGKILEVTGAERTLVEGLRRPALAGGLEELLESAGAFPTLDLELLHSVLERYDTARLWAATGWF